MSPEARVGPNPSEMGGLSLGASLHADELLGERALSKLRWRCRRGLLENDLFVERFFRRMAVRGETITTRQAEGLTALMDLSDNDLLDLLLARCELQDVLDRPEVHEVLAQMRSPPAPFEER